MSNPDFPLIPPWEDMNFAANCTAWGNWLATWLLPNPWNRLESVDGGFYQTLTLIQASFPPDLVKELASNMSMPRLAGVVNAWWTFEMYDAFDWDETATPTTLKVDSAFAQNVLLAGIEKCPEDACKAEGNTGNADITGIGVSRLFSCPTYQTFCCTDLAWTAILTGPSPARYTSRISCKPPSRLFTLSPSRHRTSETTPRQGRGIAAVDRSPGKTSPAQRRNGPRSAGGLSTPSAGRWTPSLYRRCS